MIINCPFLESRFYSHKFTVPFNRLDETSKFYNILFSIRSLEIFKIQESEIRKENIIFFKSKVVDRSGVSRRLTFPIQSFHRRYFQS